MVMRSPQADAEYDHHRGRDRGPNLAPPPTANSIPEVVVVIVDVDVIVEVHVIVGVDVMAGVDPAESRCRLRCRPLIGTPPSLTMAV